MIDGCRWILCAVVFTLLFACAGPRAPKVSPGELVLEAPGVDAQETLSGSIFPSAAKQIEARLDWPGFIDGASLEWRWSGPDGEVFFREMRLATKPEDKTSLRFDSGSGVDREGEWEVSVLFQGTIVAARHFHLTENLDHWKVINSPEFRIRSTALQALCQKSDLSFLIGTYSTDMTDHEKSIILRCLTSNLDGSVPLLDEALRSDPADGNRLVLAYKVKKDLLRRVAQGGEQVQLLDWLERLLTSYDGHDVGTLLGHKEEAVRLRAVALLQKVASKPAVLELARALEDPSPAVREAAARALRQSNAPLVREILTGKGQ